MNYHVIVSQRAIADIERNAKWWAENHSPAQALSWYEAVLNAIYSLDDNPERHGVSVENDEFPFEIRDLLCGLGRRPSYRAVFTIQGNQVHVFTVKRASEDLIQPDDFEDLS